MCAANEASTQPANPASPQPSSSTTGDNSDAEPASSSSSKSCVAWLFDALARDEILSRGDALASWSCKTVVNLKGPGGFTPLHVACLGTLTAQQRK
jgi:hypothetical protein